MGDSEHATFLYNQAVTARQEERYSDATEIFEMLVGIYPYNPQLLIGLARSYEDEDKTGKAIEVWEELCKLDPKNSDYAYELALSYRYRGWRRKAIDRLEYIVTLDPDYVDPWLELIDCYEEADEKGKVKLLTRMALDAIKEKSTESIRLYASAFELYIYDLEKDKAEDCLRAIADILENTDQPCSEACSDSIIEVADTINILKISEFIPYLRRIIAALSDQDELRMLVAEKLAPSEISAIEDEEYALSVQGFEPKIMKADDTDPRSPDHDQQDEQDEKQEPYRREGPKIGRNDPCPCGSGKKYKKCCGA